MERRSIGTLTFLPIAALGGALLGRWHASQDWPGRAGLERGKLASIVQVGANLRGADLHGAALAAANLRGTDLRRADLRGAWLALATLDSANLTRANLTHADLTRATLRYASLDSANLRGANLRGAKLFQADLPGARYDAATRWPDGFDPRAHGATLAWGALP